MMPFGVAAGYLTKIEIPVPNLRIMLHYFHSLEHHGNDALRYRARVCNRANGADGSLVWGALLGRPPK
jgi:hypothetical protein